MVCFPCRMVADPDNPLVLNVLHAASTAYSFNPDEKIDEVGIFLNLKASLCTRYFWTRQPFKHEDLQVNKKLAEISQQFNEQCVCGELYL